MMSLYMVCACRKKIVTWLAALFFLSRLGSVWGWAPQKLFERKIFMASFRISRTLGVGAFFIRRDGVSFEPKSLPFSEVSKILNSNFISQRISSTQLWTNPSDDKIGNDKNGSDDGDAASVSPTVSDFENLMTRVNRMQLEEDHFRRILKSRPRKLPYEECAKWVQAWGNRWKSKEEWLEWIEMGEKKNTYIPNRPDEYYGRLGKWQGWDHFLFGINLENDGV